MKRKFIMALALVMALSLTLLGCSAGGKGNNAASQQKNLEGSQQQEEQQGSAAEDNGKNEITIIAKSGSQQSGDEKDAVLDEITSELDEILSNANALEDVAETDLN